MKIHPFLLIFGGALLVGSPIVKWRAAAYESVQQRLFVLESKASAAEYAAQKSDRNFDRLRKRLEHFSEWPVFEK